MISDFNEHLLQFSDAITEVAIAIRTSPENRKYYSPLILAIADSLIQYQDERDALANAAHVEYPPVRCRYDGTKVPPGLAAV